MPAAKNTDAQILDAWTRTGGSPTRMAEALGVNKRQLVARMRRMGFPPLPGKPGAERPKIVFADRAPEFTVGELPPDDIPVEELVEQRIKQFDAKLKYHEAVKAIPVNVHLDGPIGILHFGDPHVDDDGCDLRTLREHSELTQEEGIFGANLGDVTNCWVGRLARLYAQQSTTAEQAWKLAEWFIGRTRWLYMVGGNHDGWAGSGDPLKWISRQSGTLYKMHGARFELRFPNKRSVLVNARHEFAGSSIYNPAHGQMKALHFGTRDHLNVGGHKHISGYGVIRDPDTGRVCHGLQVASYKVIDRYADEKGLREQAFGPAAFTVIDPRLPDTHPDMVKVFWDPQVGAAYLRSLRSRA